MGVFRYPATVRSLKFTQDDHVFLDSSVILTSMIFSKDLNKYYLVSNEILKRISESQAAIHTTPTVFSEVVDSLLALLFGNDIFLYLNGEQDKQRFSNFSLSKMCIENGIISEADITRLKSGDHSQVSFKRYINNFAKSKRRKKWLDRYITSSVTNTEQFVWNYKVKFFSSLDENHFPVRIQPIMQEMRLRSYDALHFTTAVWEGCSFFITTDEDYNRHFADS